jgi:hypothetical protein
MTPLSWSIAMSPRTEKSPAWASFIVLEVDGRIHLAYQFIES